MWNKKLYKIRLKTNHDHNDVAVNELSDTVPYRKEETLN